MVCALECFRQFAFPASIVRIQTSGDPLRGAPPFGHTRPGLWAWALECRPKGLAWALRLRFCWANYTERTIDFDGIHTNWTTWGVGYLAIAVVEGVLGRRGFTNRLADLSIMSLRRIHKLQFRISNPRPLVNPGLILLGSLCAVGTFDPVV